MLFEVVAPRDALLPHQLLEYGCHQRSTFRRHFLKTDYGSNAFFVLQLTLPFDYIHFARGPTNNTSKKSVRGHFVFVFLSNVIAYTFFGGP